LKLLWSVAKSVGVIMGKKTPRKGREVRKMAQRLWILREAPNDSLDPRPVAYNIAAFVCPPVIIMLVVEWQHVQEEGLDCEKCDVRCSFSQISIKARSRS
jgi:hypothetical protein